MSMSEIFSKTVWGVMNSEVGNKQCTNSYDDVYVQKGNTVFTDPKQTTNNPVHRDKKRVYLVCHFCQCFIVGLFHWQCCHWLYIVPIIHSPSP